MLRLPPAQTLSSRAEWLAARRIGSSDVPRILTRNGRPLSPYGGPRAVQRRLLREVVDQDDPDPDRIRGSRWEPVVVAAAEAETGRRIRRVPSHTLYQGPTEFSTVSPDSFVADDEVGQIGVGELKTDARFRWGPSRVVARWSAELAAEIREDHAYQGYYQGWALDVPWVDLIVLLPFYDLRWYRLMRDAELEGAMVTRLERFWTRHIVGRVPCAPDQVDEDRRIIERTRPVDVRGATTWRPATDVERGLADHLQLALQVRDRADETRRALSLQLVERIGRCRGLLLDRDGRRRVHVVRREDAAPYCQITERSS